MQVPDFLQDDSTTAAAIKQGRLSLSNQIPTHLPTFHDSRSESVSTNIVQIPAEDAHTLVSLGTNLGESILRESSFPLGAWLHLLPPSCHTIAVGAFIKDSTLVINNQLDQLFGYSCNSHIDTISFALEIVGPRVQHLGAFKLCSLAEDWMGKLLPPLRNLKGLETVDSVLCGALPLLPGLTHLRVECQKLRRFDEGDQVALGLRNITSLQVRFQRLLMLVCHSI